MLFFVENRFIGRRDFRVCWWMNSKISKRLKNKHLEKYSDLAKK
jgi:hypothetical protein